MEKRRKLEGREIKFGIWIYEEIESSTFVFFHRKKFLQGGQF